MINKILVVIVLYKQKLSDTLTFTSLNNALKPYKEILDVVVYDNSPAAQTIPSHQPGVQLSYIHDQANSGISKAYNTASHLAAERHKQWLLLLDQDSNLPSDFFSTLIKSIEQNPDEVVLVPVLKQESVILSPCLFKYMKGSAFKKISGGKLSLHNISILNSGMCVKLNAFLDVGGYNEAIKLDFSDHAFIHRIKKHYKHIFVTGSTIEHQLSSNSIQEEVVYNRFVQYCQGIKAYNQTEGKNNLLIFWTALRAVKLFMLYRNYAYLRTFFKSL